MKKRLIVATTLFLAVTLIVAGCSSTRYVPPPTANAPVDPQAAMQRQITALSSNMSSLQAQITRNNSQIAELSKLNDSLTAQIIALKKAPAATTPATAPPPTVPADILNRIAAIEAKVTAQDANGKQLDTRIQAIERRLGLR